MTSPQQTSVDGGFPTAWMELFHAYIDQTLTSDQWATLETVLREHPEARRTLVDLLALDSALQSDHAFCEDSTTISESEPKFDLSTQAVVAFPKTKAIASRESLARTTVWRRTSTIVLAVASLAASLAIWLG